MSDNDTFEQITPKQEHFIQAMLAGHTIIAASKIAGISSRQAHRWLNDPAIQSAYRDRQHQVFDETLSTLMTDLSIARDALIAIIKNEESPCACRVSAAKTIFDKAVEVHKISAIETRLAELEARS
jgi:phage terminase small subunit